MILSRLFKPERVHPQGSKLSRSLLAKGWGVVGVVTHLPGWTENLLIARAVPPLAPIQGLAGMDGFNGRAT
jgi:hypothetical protein